MKKIPVLPLGEYHEEAPEIAATFATFSEMRREREQRRLAASGTGAEVVIPSQHDSPADDR